MFFRHHRETYPFGNIRLKIRTPRNLSRLTDQASEAGKRGISQDAFPLVGVVWPSGQALAKFMTTFPIEGKRILEIGCGMALPTHLLNARGGDITAMDIHPIVGEYLQLNSRKNKLPDIPFHETSWSDASLLPDKFDLIIGSDVLYEPKHVKNLARFLSTHLNPDGEIILFDPDRGQREQLHVDLINTGFAAFDAKPVTQQLKMPYPVDILRYSNA